MLYTVTPNDGDGTLFVKSLDGDKVHEVPRGTPSRRTAAGSATSSRRRLPKDVEAAAAAVAAAAAAPRRSRSI